MNSLKSMCVRAGAVVAGVALPVVAFAQGTVNPFERANQQVTEIGTKAGITTSRTLPQMIGSIINVALGFLGILLLLYLLYAGFLWMTAGGDEKKTGEAKTIIKNAIIGLVIIVAAYAISTFVLSSLVNVTR